MTSGRHKLGDDPASPSVRQDGARRRLLDATGSVTVSTTRPWGLVPRPLAAILAVIRVAAATAWTVASSVGPAIFQITSGRPGVPGLGAVEQHDEAGHGRSRRPLGG